MTHHQNLHETITQNIIEAMKSAKTASMPWIQSSGLPRNVASRQCYKGINIMSLWASASIKRFTSPLWGTYRQWQALGAQVRKDQKASLVIFYQPFLKDDLVFTHKRKCAAVMKCSAVFNAGQVDGYVDSSVVMPVNTAHTIAVADQYIANTNAVIMHKNNHAYYNPHHDHIVMPDRQLFIGTDTSTATESYYSTLLHELTHWTGHAQRCHREFSNQFGSHGYAMEELIAEIGAAFLCAQLNITNSPRQDHANYISHWITLLECHNKAIFMASNKASEAVQLLDTLQPNNTQLFG